VIKRIKEEADKTECFVKYELFEKLKNAKVFIVYKMCKFQPVISGGRQG